MSMCNNKSSDSKKTDQSQLNGCVDDQSDLGKFDFDVSLWPDCISIESDVEKQKTNSDVIARQSNNNLPTYFKQSNSGLDNKCTDNHYLQAIKSAQSLKDNEMKFIQATVDKDFLDEPRLVIDTSAKLPANESSSNRQRIFNAETHQTLNQQKNTANKSSAFCIHNHNPNLIQNLPLTNTTSQLSKPISSTDFLLSQFPNTGQHVTHNQIIPNSSLHFPENFNPANNTIQSSNADLALNDLSSNQVNNPIAFPYCNINFTSNTNFTTIFNNQMLANSANCQRATSQLNQINCNNHPITSSNATNESVVPVTAQPFQHFLFEPDKRQCVSCKIIQTPIWIKDTKGNYFCNLCSINQRTFNASCTKSNYSRRKKLSNFQKKDRFVRNDIICSNCKTNQTSLWRRNAQGNVVCNACGLYIKMHGISRPISMRKDSVQKRKRNPKNLELTLCIDSLKANRNSATVSGITLMDKRNEDENKLEIKSADNRNCFYDLSVSTKTSDQKLTNQTILNQCLDDPNLTPSSSLPDTEQLQDNKHINQTMQFNYCNLTHPQMHPNLKQTMHHNFILPSVECQQNSEASTSNEFSNYHNNEFYK